MAGFLRYMFGGLFDEQPNTKRGITSAQIDDLILEICETTAGKEQRPARHIRLSSAKNKDSYVDISFHSTIKAPHDRDGHFLPPDLGHLPVENANSFEKLPNEVRSSGGVVLPINEGQAMSIHIEYHDFPLAVNVFMDTTSVIPGRKLDEEPMLGDGLKTSGSHWIDGIPICKPEPLDRSQFWVSSSVHVRQFVAISNIDGPADDLQWLSPDHRQLSLELIPRKSITHKEPYVFLETFNGLIFTTSVDLETTTVGGLKEFLWKNEGIPMDEVKFLFDGALLKDDKNQLNRCGIQHGSTILVMLTLGQEWGPLYICPRYLGDQMMTLSTGGLISQRFSRSFVDPGVWDYSRAVNFNVHFINSRKWLNITGRTPPPLPVDYKTYESIALPFFKTSDDFLESIDVTIWPKIGEERDEFLQYLRSLSNSQVALDDPARVFGTIWTVN